MIPTSRSEETIADDPEASERAFASMLGVEDAQAEPAE